jgi:hypothetical protein
MKHLLLTCILAGSLLSAQAQTPHRPDQYCILESSYRSKDRAVLKLLAGTDPAKIGLVEEVTQVANLEDETDALNYMSSHGWEVVSTSIMSSQYGANGVRYCLRRRP